MNAKELKRMSVEEFWKSGLLFEVNRRVLHPLGLALEIDADIDETDGSIQSISFGEIWDNRDDPEGIIFSTEAFQEGEKKFDAYMEARGKHNLASRFEQLGFFVQDKPVPEETEE